MITGRASNAAAFELILALEFVGANVTNCQMVGDAGGHFISEATFCKEVADVFVGTGTSITAHRYQPSLVQQTGEFQFQPPQNVVAGQVNSIGCHVQSQGNILGSPPFDHQQKEGLLMFRLKLTFDDLHGSLI